MKFWEHYCRDFWLSQISCSLTYRDQLPSELPPVFQLGWGSQSKPLFRRLWETCSGKMTRDHKSGLVPILSSGFDVTFSGMSAATCSFGGKFMVSRPCVRSPSLVATLVSGGLLGIKGRLLVCSILIVYYNWNSTLRVWNRTRGSKALSWSMLQFLAWCWPVEQKQ